MNQQKIQTARKENGRFPTSQKPIIKPLDNMINIERLLLTGLRPLAANPDTPLMPQSPRRYASA